MEEVKEMEETTIEKNEKTPKKHLILDHPVAGYFVLTLLSMLVIGGLCSVFLFLLGSFMPDFSEAIAITLASLIYLWTFRLRFRTEYKGTLTFRRFREGFCIMIIPISLICALNTVQALNEGLTTQYGKALGLALVAGIGEEVMFRTTGIANFMRVEREEKKIPVILWLSALAFGLMHAANLRAGADPVMTAVQIVSASCSGLFFGAIYLRTANIWPCIIGHTMVDFSCFLMASLLESDGILTSSLTVYEYISLVLGLGLLAIGVMITSKKHRGKILAVWDERWSRT